ncbi:MAG TPA: hypothetical protein VGN39_01335, partial [Terriglobales bacterium]|nr:hypothetical protein [Terriglobales bacterium]
MFLFSKPAFSFNKRLRIRRIQNVALVALLTIAAEIGFSQSSTPVTLDRSEIIQFLSSTINWYHQTATEQQLITEPTDLTFFQDNRRVAQQVVQLAFEFARQQADARAKQKLQTQAQGGVPSQYQSLVQLAEKADQEVQETQAEIPPLQKKLETAPAGKRAGINALIAETQSEVALFSARRDALRSMAEFASGASGNGAGASGLRAQIEELARSVPSNLSNPSNTTSSQTEEQDSVKVAPIANREPPSGIWGLSADLFRLSHKERALKQDIAATEALIQSSKELRAPLVTKLKAMIDAGDQLAKEADTST